MPRREEKKKYAIFQKGESSSVKGGEKALREGKGKGEKKKERETDYSLTGRKGDPVDVIAGEKKGFSPERTA